MNSPGASEWSCCTSALSWGREQKAGVSLPVLLPPKRGEGRQNLEPTLGHPRPFTLRWGFVKVLQRKGLCGEADVAVTVEPHGKWVPVGHQEPLSQVKFGAKDEQRPFNILLYHPLAVLHHHGVAIYQLQHLLQVVHTHDASSSGLGSRLHDPDVAISFHVHLGHHSPQLLQDVLTALDLSVEVPEFCPLVDHLVVALEEDGPALRAEVQRRLQVLVDVHVSQVAKVLLTGAQSLIHKLWGHHHWLFLLFLGLFVSWGLFLFCLDRV